MNTNYFASSVLKASEFTRVRSTSENSDVFNSRDEICLVFTDKEVNFLLFLTFYRLHAMSRPLKKEVLKKQKRKILANQNNFGTKIFVTSKLNKCISTLDVFVHK